MSRSPAATQDIVTGATAAATMLGGGFEDVLGGGTAIGNTVDGGYEYVAAGGTIISAGTLEVASGGSAGLVAFSGAAGTRLLDDAMHQ